MSIVRVGDIVRDLYGNDNALIMGHHLGKDGTPNAWSALFMPISQDIEAFIGYYPYDFAEQDATRPGALMPADPWSTWTA
ncbi:MAG TPA: hypothetical protein VLD66_00010 [Methyloceanibacter sp.]|nr:hypothetical protein [Methyloceanibacter sp.]